MMLANIASSCGKEQRARTRRQEAGGRKQRIRLRIADCEIRIAELKSRRQEAESRGQKPDRKGGCDLRGNAKMRTRISANRTQDACAPARDCGRGRPRSQQCGRSWIRLRTWTSAFPAMRSVIVVDKGDGAGNQNSAAGGSLNDWSRL